MNTNDVITPIADNEQNNSKAVDATEKTDNSEKSETTKDSAAKEEIQQILSDDCNSSKQLKIDFQPELVTTWTKWTQERLPEKTKESILELYSRKGVLFTEAPKVKLEVMPVLSKIAVKRGKPFLET